MSDAVCDAREWMCAQCTLLNSAPVAACEACGAAKGADAAADSSEVDSDTSEDSAGDDWYGASTAIPAACARTVAAREGGYVFRAAREAEAEAEATSAWRVVPKPTSCQVEIRFDLCDLPDVGVATSLGLNESAQLRLVITFAAFACESSAGVDTAQLLLDFRQELGGGVPEEAEEEEEDGQEEEACAQDPARVLRGVLRSHGLSVFLPEVARHALAQWEADGARSYDVQGKKRLRGDCVAHEVPPSPQGHANLFTFLARRLWAALTDATRNCCICRAALSNPGLRLAPCGNQACAYAYEECNLLDVLPLLREGDGMPASLHIALAHAAATSSRAGSCCFEPFPSWLTAQPQQRPRAGFFDQCSADAAQAAMTATQSALNKKLGLAAVAAALACLPPVRVLAALKSETALRVALRRLDWSRPPTDCGALEGDVAGAAALWKASLPDLAYKVLRFVLASARFSLLPLREDACKLVIPGSAAQLAVVGCSEAREARFQARRAAAGGSSFAFHGSPLDSWYSIARNGIRSLSGSHLQSNGAAYGTGIYLADTLTTSWGYSSRTDGGFSRASSILQGGLDLSTSAGDTHCLVAVVEMVRGASRVAPHTMGGIWVVSNDDDVAVRYLLLLSRLTGGQTDASAAPLASALRWGELPLQSHLDWLHERAAQAAALRRDALRAARDQREQQTRAPPPPPPPTAADSALDAAAANCEQSSGGSVSALRAIARELRSLSRSSSALALTVTLPDERDAIRWRIHMRDWEDAAPLLASDLSVLAAETGRSAEVELELFFDKHNFPFAPPFVRVVRPIFQFHTGHVTIGGSICTELLTSRGWTPAIGIESLLVNIRADLAAGGARLDMRRARGSYSESEARAAFTRVAREHGWET